MKSRFGHIERIAPEKYRVYWYDGGKRKSKQLTGDRDTAEQFLAHVRLGDGLLQDMPWGSYYEQAVKPTYEGLAAKTVSDYERLWKRELAPRISSRLVSSTDWRFVEKTLNRIESPSVQRHAMRLWRKMCNLAIRDGLLDRNPVDRSIKLKPEKRRKKEIYTADEVIPVLDSVRGTLFERLVILELCGGLRHEEAIAITPEDITFEDSRAIVSVSKALLYVDGSLIRKETKTAFSDREIVLSGVFCERLRNAPFPERPQLPTTVTHNWRVSCQRQGRKHVRFGDMRSNFATLACECCDSSLVSLFLGHGDGTTRGRHYQLATRKAMEIVADSLADYVVSC